MKLGWMGEHREIVEALVHYCNIYAGVYRIEKMNYQGISYSYSQIQVLEFLLENEDHDENMSTIAHRLGISRSNFTKIVNRLEKKGLVEKTCLSGSRRDICVHVNELGRRLDEDYTKNILKTHYSAMFENLDKLSPEDRIHVRNALLDAMRGSDFQRKAEKEAEKP